MLLKFHLSVSCSFSTSQSEKPLKNFLPSERFLNFLILYYPAAPVQVLQVICLEDMDEADIQAALNAQLLVHPNPPMAHDDEATPREIPTDPETNEQQPQRMEQIPDRPLRQPPPDHQVQQDRGINDAREHDAPHLLINFSICGFDIAISPDDLLCLYHKLRWWYFWAYFLSLGLFGESRFFLFFFLFSPLQT